MGSLLDYWDEVSVLKPYRVLDIADVRGQFGGMRRLLHDRSLPQNPLARVIP